MMFVNVIIFWFECDSYDALHKCWLLYLLGFFEILVHFHILLINLGPILFCSLFFLPIPACLKYMSCR